MVNPADLVDLDPEPEDILSMWGKDITAQNVEHYFGAIELSRLEALTQAGEKPSFLFQGGDPSSGDFTSSFSVFPKQVGSDNAVVGTNEEGLHPDPKGKVVPGRFAHSKGFEEIAHLGLSSGFGLTGAPRGLPTLSRVSLPRDFPPQKGVFARGFGERSAGEREGFNASTARLTPLGFQDTGIAGQHQTLPEIEPHVGSVQTNPARNEVRRGARASEEELRSKGAKRRPQRPIGSQVIDGNPILGMEVSSKNP